MTDELDGLLARVTDPALRADLRAHFDRARAKRSFGLVFESHLPERVNLVEHPIRIGSKVVVRDDADSPTFQVIGFAGDTATLRAIRHADGSRLAADEAEAADEVTCELSDLVVTADFDDPIYPGLRILGSVEQGGDKPAQVVIKGENHHVLEALRFTHAGKIDCIYIDPPYNTGAKDWKYDNNYVDDTDAYRHSKWLAFMERRLLLAKELLNPQRSVLIVTIDAREHLRLGLLLEQTFPGCPVQMASIVINPSGAGNDGVNRVDEYAFFVSVGKVNVPSGPDDMLNDADAPNARVKGGLSWESFLRSGTTWYRSERPNLCYPIFIKAETGEILGAGEPLQGDDENARTSTKDDCSIAWPIRRDGRLGIWRRDRAALESLVAKGYAYASGRDDKRGTWSIKYLLDGTVKLIESGQVDVNRSGSKGQVQASRQATIGKVAKSVWFRSSHNAGKHGSDLVRTFLPGRKFPFPKSLYAVEDSLRFCVGGNPDAVVLDFFAGSGTTAHAVARLNRQDSGRRQSILVTNNEVSPAEAKTLRAAGHRPGDAEWEALGIFGSSGLGGGR